MVAQCARRAPQEFSHVRLPVLRQLYDAYSFSVIPAMGDLVAKDRAAYQV